jgi:hypothetical protein
MLAILQDLSLETYVKESLKVPVVADPSKLTKDISKAIKKWETEMQICE